MADFEERSKKYEYSPKREEFDRQELVELNTYYGTVIAPNVLQEMRVWAEIIGVLKDGIPKPYDNSVIVSKITRLEKQTNQDLSDLKTCCPPSAEVREAKELKPYIFAILDRIVDISGMQQYVEKYKNNG